jgi:hypothetical protein
MNGSNKEVYFYASLWRLLTVVCLVCRLLCPHCVRLSNIVVAAPKRGSANFSGILMFRVAYPCALGWYGFYACLTSVSWLCLSGSMASTWPIVHPSGDGWTNMEHWWGTAVGPTPARLPLPPSQTPHRPPWEGTCFCAVRSRGTVSFSTS